MGNHHGKHAPSYRKIAGWFLKSCNSARSEEKLGKVLCRETAGLADNISDSSGCVHVSAMGICKEWSYHIFINYCWSSELRQLHTHSYPLPLQNKYITLNWLESGFAFKFLPSPMPQWVGEDGSASAALEVSTYFFLFRELRGSPSSSRRCDCSRGKGSGAQCYAGARAAVKTDMERPRTREFVVKINYPRWLGWELLRCAAESCHVTFLMDIPTITKNAE